METIKEDRRVKRTKRAIRNAFAALLAQKDINKITVKDIAEAADINRKTFYNYYSGVYQVVDDIENNIVQRFDELLQKSDPPRALNDPTYVFEKLTQILNEDIEFYGNLFSISGNNNLREKLLRTLKSHALESAKTQSDLPKNMLEIAVNYILSGLFGVYQQWFDGGRQTPLEEITKTAGQLTLTGLSGLVKDAKARK